MRKKNKNSLGKDANPRLCVPARHKPPSPGPRERRARRPLRGHAAAWSPRTSSTTPGTLAPPHNPYANGRRRRKATCMWAGGRAVPASVGMAVSQAPARGPDFWTESKPDRTATGWAATRARESDQASGTVESASLFVGSRPQWAQGGSCWTRWAADADFKAGMWSVKPHYAAVLSRVQKGVFFALFQTGLAFKRVWQRD